MEIVRAPHQHQPSLWPLVHSDAWAQRATHPSTPGEHSVACAPKDLTHSHPGRPPPPLRDLQRYPYTQFVTSLRDEMRRPWQILNCSREGNEMMAANLNKYAEMIPDQSPDPRYWPAIDQSPDPRYWRAIDPLLTKALTHAIDVALRLGMADEEDLVG